MLRSLIIVLILTLSHAAATAQWTNTGSLHVGRQTQPAILLPSGQVYVVGGNQNVAALKSTEFYDPSTNTWTPGPALGIPRSFHSATLLPDGRVLVVGGNGLCLNGSGLVCVYRSAELYDPAKSKWTLTGAMKIARGRQAAPLLPNGDVPIVSGSNSNTQDQYGIAQSELYDPAAGAFSLTGSQSSARAGLTVNVLAKGQVLAAGGCGIMLSNCAVSELYNPSMRKRTTTGSLNTGRDYHASSLLPDGRVLVAGGENVQNPLGTNLESAEIYDPSTGEWTNAGHMDRPPQSFGATLLLTGAVLVEGGVPTGQFGVSALTSAELFTAAN